MAVPGTFLEPTRQGMASSSSAAPSRRLGRLHGHLAASPAAGKELLLLLAGAALGVGAAEARRRRTSDDPDEGAGGSVRRRELGSPEMTRAEQRAEGALVGLMAADLTVAATAPPAEVARVLEDYGAVIIERLLPESTMDRVDEQLERCIQTERSLRGVDRQDVLSRRMGAEVLVGAPATRQLLTNPLVTSSVTEILGRHSKRLALKLLEVVYLQPGGAEQVMHREDGLWPSTHEPFDWVVDCMWAISDFTEANGGTLVIPRSHRWRREREAERPEVSISCVMPKGSVLLWTGGTLHAGGANATEVERKSLLSGYVCSWLRSEHRFWAFDPLRDLVKNRERHDNPGAGAAADTTEPGEVTSGGIDDGGIDPPLTDELCDLLGFGPTDGTAPGGGGAPRDGWSSPRSQHYYLGRTQEQAVSQRDPQRYDGAAFFERYYEVTDPSSGAAASLSQPTPEEEED